MVGSMPLRLTWSSSRTVATSITPVATRKPSTIEFDASETLDNCSVPTPVVSDTADSNTSTGRLLRSMIILATCATLGVGSNAWTERGSNMEAISAEYKPMLAPMSTNVKPGPCSWPSASIAAVVDGS